MKSFTRGLIRSLYLDMKYLVFPISVIEKELIQLAKKA